MAATFMTASLVALGWFWCSVVGMRFAYGLTYMFRKVVHSTMQVAGVALVYATSLPTALSSDTDATIRCAAMFVVFAIMPAVLLTRGPLKRYHNEVGRAGLLAYAALVFGLAVLHTRSHRVARRTLV